MDRYVAMWVLPLTFGLCAGAAGGQTAPVGTAPAKKDARGVWGKIWAYRCARAQAAAALVGQVADMPLDAGRTVGTFLDESPARRRALEAFLLGVSPTGEPEHRPDGTCELALEVPLADLAAALADIRDRYGRGESFGTTDFTALAAKGKPPLRRQVKAKAHPALTGEPLIARDAAREYFDRAPPAVKAFWEKRVTAEARAQAELRAREDALRRLGERVREVRIDQQTSLADYVARSERQDADMRQFLRAVREKGLRYHPDAPLVEVETAVTLRTVYACLKAWVLARPAGGDVRHLEDLIVAARGASIAQTGIGWSECDRKPDDDKRLLRAVALAKAAPEWFGRGLRETGRGKGKPPAPGSPGPDDKAVRAAEWHARTALAERLWGLSVGEGATIGQLAGRDEQSRAAFLAALLDARPVGEPAVADDGATEVTLEMPLAAPWRLVLYWHRRKGP